MGALIRSMNFLSTEASLFLSKSFIWPCIEYCCVLTGTPICYLVIMNKIQKRMYSIVGASLETLAYCQNVTSLTLSYRYYFGRCLFELALHFFVVRLLVNLMGYMISFSSFLDVNKMSMSIVYFLAQLDIEILCF